VNEPCGARELKGAREYQFVGPRREQLMVCGGERATLPGLDALAMRGELSQCVAVQLMVVCCQSGAKKGPNPLDLTSVSLLDVEKFDR